MPRIRKWPQQERFCLEYIIDFNATQAAIRAGYKPNSAGVTASKLLSQATIQERLRELLAEREKRCEITADRVLKELAVLAFSDIKNYIVIDEDTGAIRARGFDEMPEDASRALMSVTEDRTIKEDAKDNSKVIVYDKVNFRMHDKPKALDMVARHLGMFKDKLELSGQVKTADKLVIEVVHTRPVEKPGGNGGNGHDKEGPK